MKLGTDRETAIFEHRTIKRIRGLTSSVEADPVIKEVPLTIMLNDEEFATLVCSPGFERELVVGFLAGEGLLKEPSDIRDYFFRETQGVVWIETHTKTPTEGFLSRNFASCCGKGRPSLYYVNDASQVEPVEGNPVYTADSVLELVRLLEESSHSFRLTGGVHSAALSAGETVLAVYEDIGRHNALDRIMGYVFLNSVDTSNMAIVLSGRISSEILIKAARMRVPVVISKNAPTALAIDLADELGITVVGFARGNGINVYSHEGRISHLTT